jgi:hypothetical protein
VNVLRQLEQHDTERHGRFAGAVLIAAPAHEIGYDAPAEFFAEPFDWARIKHAARTCRVLAAADDSILVPEPFGHVAELVEGLGATALVTATGGHFGAHPDDHIDLPQAFELIGQCLDVHSTNRPVDH